jgi:hypothetical protein
MFKKHFSNTIFKIIILFIISFIFRILINNYFDINIYEVFFLFFSLNIFDFSFEQQFPIKKSFNMCNELTRNNNKKDYNLLRESVSNSKKGENLNIIQKSRRKIYWIFLESRKDHFINYKDWKSSWNSDVNLRKELYSWIKLQKKTLNWFFKPKK